MSPGDLVPRPDPTALTASAVAQAKEDLRREIAQVKEVLEARMSAMDKATELLAKTVDSEPTKLQTEISYLRQLFEARLSGHDDLSHAWREGVEQRFSEVEARFTQQQQTSKDALEAALRAARELGELQNRANALANAKTEELVAGQLKALTDKVDVNAQRLDKGEGEGAGARTLRGDNLASLNNRLIGLGVALSAVVIVVNLIIFFVVHK